MVELFLKNSNLCDHNSPTSQTDGRTDGQTTCDRNTALCTKVHRAVKTLLIWKRRFECWDHQDIATFKTNTLTSTILKIKSKLLHDDLVVACSTSGREVAGSNFESAGCRLSCRNRGPVALCILGLLNPPSSLGR